MEEQKDRNEMLELMPQPAFCVENGIIVQLNQAARRLLIEPQTSITALLPPDTGEYEEFQGGCLCLTLDLPSCPSAASVTRMDGFDIFVIEQEADDIGLNSMAVAALGLREPLSDVITISDHLLPMLANEPDVQEQIAHMSRSLSQLHRQVCNMSDALRFAHDTAPRMEYADVCAVLAEIFEHARTLAGSSGVEVHYAGPREPVYSMICPERLERAVYNMISNAMKYAQSGSSIDAKLTRRGKKLSLSVQDSGSGIPGSVLSSVGRRYRRYPGLEEWPNGVGLGLSLVRYAATAHGGTVLVDQPGGRGTRITMTIAIRQDKSGTVRSNVLKVDYAGERDHGLLELSDVLPPEMYAPKN